MASLPLQTDRAPKVLRIITRLNIGGPAIHVLMLTRELGAHGYQTHLITGACQEREGDAMYPVSPVDAVTSVREMTRAVSPWKDLRALWRIYQVIRRERPLIVHTHTAKAGCLGRIAARMAGVPIIIHTFHGNSLATYFNPMWNGIFCRIEQALARITDRICVVSEQQATELCEQFAIAPSHKFRVVPLGLDLESELSVPAPELADGCLTVGWLGRLVPVKGIPLLIAVIEETLRRTDRIRFLVVGDGPERNSIQEALERVARGRCEWVGWQRDVRPYLERCNVLIQTSRNEGTPVALIQGMAAARPFVSTPVGGVVDLAGGPVLEQSLGCRWYAHAVLAPPDPAAFAGALERLLARPAQLSAMGQHARHFAAQRFQKSRLLADLDALYREIIQRKQKIAALERQGKSLWQLRNII